SWILHPGLLDPGLLDPASWTPDSWILDPGFLHPGLLDPGLLDPGLLDPGLLDPGSWILDPGFLDTSNHFFPNLTIQRLNIYMSLPKATDTTATAKRSGSCISYEASPQLRIHN
ncbi:hypothetical protein Vretimale_16956, partial [Volvox reticuliferus]